MQKIKNLVSLSAILFFSFFLLAVAGTACTAKTTEKIEARIGYETTLSNFPFFVAYELGYFEEEFIDIKIIKFNTTNEQTLALLSGQVDMIPNSSMALLVAAEAEHPDRFKVFIAHGDLGNKILVRDDSTITSIYNLANLKLGTYPGTTMETYSKISLDRYFDESEFPTIVAMQPPNLVEALASKQVDAIYVPEPIVSVAIQKIGAKEILDNPLGNIMSPFTGGASVFSKEFVDKHPKESTAIMRAMEKAIDFIRENESESRDILAKYTGFEAELLQSSTLGYIWKLNEIDIEAIQTLAGILYEAGVVEHQVNTTNWYYINK